MNDNIFYTCFWVIAGTTIIGIILGAKSCISNHLNLQAELHKHAAENGCIYLEKQSMTICDIKKGKDQ